MKRIVLIIAALAAHLLAADEVARRLVEVKYVNPSSIRDLLSGFGVGVRPDDSLKAIVLIGPPEAVTQAEALIHKLDVPQPVEKNIELLAYLVLASNETQSGPEPADLAPAIRQLHGLFPYKSYRLLDTIWVRTRENNHIESSGLAPVSLKTDPNFNPVYRLSADRARILPGDVPVIRFDALTLDLLLRESERVRLSSSFDVRQGQKVVIGKTNPTGTDGAIVVVVTAKIVE